MPLTMNENKQLRRHMTQLFMPGMRSAAADDEELYEALLKHFEQHWLTKWIEDNDQMKAESLACLRAFAAGWRAAQRST